MTDTTDPTLTAARAHCEPGCAGPDLYQLSGLAPPHRCSPNPAALVGQQFVRDSLHGTAELSRQVTSARTWAVTLEQQLAELTTLARDVVGDHCEAHAEFVESCDVCQLLAFLSTAPGDLQDALAALTQPVLAERED